MTQQRKQSYTEGGENQDARKDIFLPDSCPKHEFLVKKKILLKIIIIKIKSENIGRCLGGEFMNTVITTMLTASWHGELPKLITLAVAGCTKCCYIARSF